MELTDQEIKLITWFRALSDEDVGGLRAVFVFTFVHAPSLPRVTEGIVVLEALIDSIEGS